MFGSRNFSAALRSVNALGKLRLMASISGVLFSSWMKSTCFSLEGSR